MSRSIPEAADRFSHAASAWEVGCLRGLALGSFLLDLRDNIIRVFAGTTVQFAHSHMWTHQQGEEGGGRVTGDPAAVPPRDMCLVRV